LKTGKIKDLWSEQEKFRVETIESIMPESGLILDIGSGGLEYNTRNCTSITMDINRGKPTTFGNAESLPYKNETFDLLISTELIEHVRYPKKLFDEVHRVLKSNGRWLLSTPNVATLANRFALIFLGRFPPDRTLHDENDVGHIHFWDKKYLLQVLDQNGFTVIKSWYKFLQISRNSYISSWVAERIFKNFCDQNIYLCSKKTGT
jgi:ubiquinone/menaquinone biosynthesis C-methylase UbiE